VVFPSTKADITFPSAVKLKLIFAPSFIVSPVAPVLLIRSEPAKSTKFSFPALIRCFPSACNDAVSMYIVKIEWERELSEFIAVEAVLRLWEPKFIARSISGIDFTTTYERSFTKIPLSGFSLISNLVGLTPLFFSSNRSYTSSL
jgi:hypothetical protein